MRRNDYLGTLLDSKREQKLSDQLESPAVDAVLRLFEGEQRAAPRVHGDRAQRQDPQGALGHDARRVLDAVLANEDVQRAPAVVEIYGQSFDARDDRAQRAKDRLEVLRVLARSRYRNGAISPPSTPMSRTSDGGCAVRMATRGSR